MKIRVLIVEEFPLTREGVAKALARDSRIEVVGKAADGVQGLELARRLKPHVVVLELDLPALDGVTLLDRLREDVPQARALVLSASEQVDSLLAAVGAGAAGYLSKRSSTEDIRSAVVTVHEGGAVVAPALARHLLERYSRATRGDDLTARPLLTPRERTVLRLVAQGHTDHGVAEILHVSARTVQNDLARIRDKTGLRRRSELVRWAVEHDL